GGVVFLGILFVFGPGEANHKGSGACDENEEAQPSRVRHGITPRWVKGSSATTTLILERITCRDVLLRVAEKREKFPARFSSIKVDTTLQGGVTWSIHNLAPCFDSCVAWPARTPSRA